MLSINNYKNDLELAKGLVKGIEERDQVIEKANEEKKIFQEELKEVHKRTKQFEQNYNNMVQGQAPSKVFPSDKDKVATDSEKKQSKSAKVIELLNERGRLTLREIIQLVMGKDGLDVNDKELYRLLEKQYAAMIKGEVDRKTSIMREKNNDGRWVYYLIPD